MKKSSGLSTSLALLTAIIVFFVGSLTSLAYIINTNYPNTLTYVQDLLNNKKEKAPQSFTQDFVTSTSDSIFEFDLGKPLIEEKDKSEIKRACTVYEITEPEISSTKCYSPSDYYDLLSKVSQYKSYKSLVKYYTNQVQLYCEDKKSDLLCKSSREGLRNTQKFADNYKEEILVIISKGEEVK